jgi:hypothetical protein
VNGIVNIYDLNFAMGGPISQDKLWWFSAHRHWGQEIGAPNVYENGAHGQPGYRFVPDLTKPVSAFQWNQSDNIRVTWKVTERAKLSISHDFQFNCPCTLNLAQGTTSWEAANESRWRSNMSQMTWTYPATNNLLFSAGGTVLIARYHVQPPKGAPTRTTAMISVLEQTGVAGAAPANFRYNAPATTHRDTRG